MVYRITEQAEDFAVASSSNDITSSKGKMEDFLENIDSSNLSTVL